MFMRHGISAVALAIGVQARYQYGSRMSSYYGPENNDDIPYGYDTVRRDLDLDAGIQITIRDNLIDGVDMANERRIMKIDHEFSMRLIRLQQMLDEKEEKLRGPFEYQRRLIEEEI